MTNNKMKQILYNIHTQTNAEVLHINGAVQYKKQQYLRLPTYTQNNRFQSEQLYRWTQC